jgi:phytoene synthase
MAMFGVTSFKSSSFAPAFWLLGPRRRSALAAVYAFAREVDDAVDEIGLDGNDPVRARRILAAWRNVLAGGPVTEDVSLKIWRPLERAMTQFPIDRENLLELVEGVGRDLSQTRYATWNDTKSYCYGVAGTVGLVCLPIFGLDPIRHREFAVTLGQAVQMVNILRDVKVDALRDRIYLPQEDLKRFNLSDQEILGLVYNADFRRLMKFEADRTQDLFTYALSVLPRDQHSTARPALVMGRLYRRLLDKLEKRQFEIFTGRPRLSLIEKISSLVA